MINDLQYYDIQFLESLFGSKWASIVLDYESYSMPDTIKTISKYYIDLILRGIKK